MSNPVSDAGTGWRPGALRRLIPRVACDVRSLFERAAVAAS